jgi:ribose transport system ATP-binding protein
MSDSTPIVSIRNLSKTFAGTKALDDVDLEIGPGEVHALLGQNGSGKSTLIKVLSGYHAPDPGAVISVRGTPVKLPIPTGGSRRLGIAFMHQDLGLVATMSVLENLRVGRFETGAGWRVRWRAERQRARALLERFDLHVDPRAPVASLSSSERAIVGIIRALDEVEQAQGAGLLVLDEPTAALPEDEVEVLFEAVRRVVASGSSVLFVSHSLSEVLTISDRVSVLRDGKLVARRDTADVDAATLIELIVGRELGALYPTIEHVASDPVVEAEDLSGAVAQNVSLKVHEGELLGLTGLVGAGYDEVPYLLYGALSRRSGSVRVRGQELSRLTPQRAKAAGLALLPADRQRAGGIMRATVGENVTLASLGDYRGRFGLNHRRERSAVQQVLHDFNVQPPLPGRRLATLSGGNQQKALLGRWIHMRPDVLMLHEPTQGVDVGSRKTIFEILQRAARDGMGIVYASSEYEDLANVCDRVIVFRNGRAVAELSGASLTHDQLLACCYSAEAPAPA